MASLCEDKGTPSSRKMPVLARPPGLLRGAEAIPPPLTSLLIGSLRLQTLVLGSLLHCRELGFWRQCNQKPSPILRCFVNKGRGWYLIYNHNRSELLHNSWEAKMSHFIVWTFLYCTDHCMDQTISNSATPVWLGKKFNNGHLGAPPLSRLSMIAPRAWKGYTSPRKSTGLCGCLHLCVLSSPSVWSIYYQFKAKSDQLAQVLP